MTDRVLLTGISGFVGGHVALQLLRAGYIVRGSVRDLRKAGRVRDTLGRAGGDVSRLEFVALDLNDDAGWDEAMAGVRYLQHTASPFVTHIPADKMELVRPAVDGTRRALTAALAAGVERVVLTSSVAAVIYGHDPDRRTAFTADDWTNLTGPGVNAYTESKTRAEQEAWAIMDAAGRHNDLVAINPGVILGPLLDDDPGTSVSLVKRLFDGSLPATARITLSVVDVRDVAEAHVAAMVDPAAGGRRFPMANGERSMIEMANVLREAMPDRRNKIARFEAPDFMVRLFAIFDNDARGNVGELGAVRPVDGSAGATLLRQPAISPEDAIIASAGSLIAHRIA